MSKRTVIVAVCLAGALLGQEAPALRQTLELAAKSYPSLQVSVERVNEAAAGIRLARTAYLPKVDAIAQVNRATRNNVFGTLLPQSTIAPISGPVIGSNNLGSVWGSAVGGLVTWEPFDFGLRGAKVAAAEAAKAQSEAARKQAEFDLLVSAADAYLTVVAAQETLRAAQAGVAQAEAVQKVTAAQVGAELRPGADESRAEAEVAAARTQWIQAGQALDVARANLAQFTGAEPVTVDLPAGGMGRLPEAAAPAAPVGTHPAVAAQRAAVDQARAQLRVLARSYFPKFALQAAVSARGTGAEIDGRRLGGANGLAPDTQNYALGFTVTFPIMDRPALRAQADAENAGVRAREAQARQVELDLKTQWRKAVATFEGARRVAQNTPVQLTAARAAVRQATARYESGLGNIAEVADAQRLLAQTEIDDALARLGVWRGLLAIAAASGDLEPFLAEAAR